MSQAGRRSAILIGSSQFDKEPLKARPLKCPERDVDGLAELLSAAEIGAYGEVFLFKNSHHQTPLDQIEEVLTTAARDDQVLIYYSGHGETDLPGRLYLTASNTDVKKLVSTSIPVETLRTMIENSLCRKIILILDCCFGGAAGKSFVKGSVDEKLKELARGYGVYILTASTAAQTAHEREGDQYGLLTKHIIAGIKEGAAANDKGLVSMDGLYSYVHRQVTGEGHQEPMRWALNVKGEDLIIARAGKAPAREKQRLLIEKLIEMRAYLPPQMFADAIQVVQERRAPYYDLVDDLYHRQLTLGEFVQEWYAIELAERLPQPEPPPKPTEIAAAALKENPPATAEPPPPPPANKPATEAVQSSGFSQQTTAASQPPEGGTLNTLAASKLPEVGPPNTFMLKPQPALTWSLRTRLIVVAAIIGVVVLYNVITRISRPGTDTSNPTPTPVSTPNSDVKPLDEFTEDLNGVKLEMVRVPGGRFKMGSQAGTGSGDERPQHDVTVPSFYIGKYEITRAQWKAVMGAGNNPSRFKGDDIPVENASWNDAKEFCTKLSDITRRQYRLPSEAEWEYACRAGNNGDYAGNLDAMAWYDKNSGDKAHPVGQKKPNDFGLFDMHGNVWEWCEDFWHDNYEKAPTDGSAWLIGGDSSLRVLRGGSWINGGTACRSALRLRKSPGAISLNYGFRVVVSAWTKNP